MSQPLIRVMVVDNQPVICDGVRWMLRKVTGIVVCGEAAGAAEAVAAAEKLQPDVAVIGLCLSDGSAAEAVEQIRERRPETRFVIFSGLEVDEVLANRISEVSAYALKRSKGPELVQAIRAAANGHDHFDSFMIGAVLDRFRNSNGSTGVIPQLDGPRLTPKEEAVLRLIGKELLNKQIASQLRISNKTVERHVSKIKTKLGVDGRVGMALYALANLPDERTVGVIEVKETSE
jgi:DNA-binding NarL/FixJ family response regulator